MISAYFSVTKPRLTFMVPVSSPPGMDRSVGRKANFWIFWALLAQASEPLYFLMPAST